MKTALQISLLGNVLLMGALGLLSARRHDLSPAPQLAPPPAERAAPEEPRVLPASPPAPMGGFEWRQLESSNYPTYVANLRTIRCPEQTVRDIVTADVAGLFARKRQEMRIPNSTDSGRWSRTEEANLVAALLGDPMNRGEQLASSPEENHTAAGPARLPWVFQTQALAALRLSDDQKEEIDEMARQFIADIGGTDQDPHDPAYFERWQKAQAKADSLIVGAIGRRALVDLDQAAPPPDAGNE